jgi:hypothetical protein
MQQVMARLQLTLDKLAVHLDLPAGCLYSSPPNEQEACSANPDR